MGDEAPAGFDLDGLTILDVMDIEDELNIGISEIEDMLEDPTVRKGKVMAVIAWVVARHDNPDITLREAAQNITLKAFTASPPLADARPTGTE